MVKLVDSSLIVLLTTDMPPGLSVASLPAAHTVSNGFLTWRRKAKGKKGVTSHRAVVWA